MSLLITGIGELVTNDPDAVGGAADDLLGLLHNAAVLVDDGLVAWVGQAEDAPAADEAVNVEGRAVLPGFVDSHSHLLFAGIGPRSSRRG